MSAILTTNTEKKFGLSGSTLKTIAIAAMLIDHIAAGILGRLVKAGIAGTEVNFAYMIMRLIGRVAFPIFVFLLVEGFFYTKSKEKYALRLLAFALISEVPFDLVNFGTTLEFTYQNVYFTLLIGMTTMMMLDAVRKTKFSGAVKVAKGILIVFAGMITAEILNTDYASFGILCITLAYVLHESKVSRTVAGCLAFACEVTAPLAYIPMWFYNGKRGLNLKYVFYLFYPAHLLAIYFACVALGIHTLPTL